jgi:3-oxoacyl-[acyl-carrier protein] reductase
MKQKVLITGGNGDIATAIKNKLEKNGFLVEAPSHLEMDVTNWDSINKFMSHFVPDILINNAGYVFPQSIKSAQLETTKRHIDVNLGGVFYCAEIALRYNKGVSIINIGSAASIEIHPTWSEYCATKAAVVMATKCWSEDGIYAVCISPGRTKTKMRKSLFPNEDQSTLLEPDDFASIVLKAVKKEYPSGDHVVVRKQNVQDLLLK